MTAETIAAPRRLIDCRQAVLNDLYPLKAGIAAFCDGEESLSADPYALIFMAHECIEEMERGCVEPWAMLYRAESVRALTRGAELVLIEEGAGTPESTNDPARAEDGKALTFLREHGEAINNVIDALTKQCGRPRAQKSVTATTRDITSLIGHEGAIPSAADQNLLARMEDARIVFDALANDAGREEPWGLLTLVELACEAVHKAVDERGTVQANDASCVMAAAISLANAVNRCDESGDMGLLLPALSLLTLAKENLDDWIQSTRKAAS